MHLLGMGGRRLDNPVSEPGHFRLVSPGARREHASGARRIPHSISSYGRCAFLLSTGKICTHRRGNGGRSRMQAVCSASG